MKLYNSKTINDAESLVFSRSVQSIQELRSFLRDHDSGRYADLNEEQIAIVKQSYFDEVEKWEYITECLTDNKI